MVIPKSAFKAPEWPLEPFYVSLVYFYWVWSIHLFINFSCQTRCFEKILENLTKISDFSLYCPYFPHHEAESTYSNGPKDCQTYVSIQ